MKNLEKVCDEVRKRVSKMTRKQKLKLSMEAACLRQDYELGAKYRDLMRKHKD